MLVKKLCSVSPDAQLMIASTPDVALLLYHSVPVQTELPRTLHPSFRAYVTSTKDQLLQDLHGSSNDAIRQALQAAMMDGTLSNGASLSSSMTEVKPEWTLQAEENTVVQLNFILDTILKVDGIQQRAQINQILAKAKLLSLISSKVTSTALTFCLRNHVVQWGILVDSIIDDILEQFSFERDKAALALYQYLAFLALHSTRQALAFPTKEAVSVAVYQLVVKLCQVGLCFAFQIPRQDGKSAARHFIVSSWLAPCVQVRIDDAADELSLSSEINDTTTENTIVTETNLRLYCYTSNKNLISIVRMFAEPETAMTGFQCFHMTRASIIHAMSKGVRAAEVLHFLSLRSHPIMRRSATLNDSTVFKYLPQAVCDQILIWEKEGRRFEFEENCVLLSFRTNTVRDRLLETLKMYAEKHLAAGKQTASNVILYRSHFQIVISKDTYDALLAMQQE